jgi:hypothetical protein
MAYLQELAKGRRWLWTGFEGICWVTQVHSVSAIEQNFFEEEKDATA